jgi:hypothetical protein
MKNYNLTANQAGLVRNIADQAIKHRQHLPPGVRQVFTIDTRGQVCTPEMKSDLIGKILSKTRDILSDKDIIFW